MQIEAKRKTWSGSTGALNHANLGTEMRKTAGKTTLKGIQTVTAVIYHFFVSANEASASQDSRVLKFKSGHPSALEHGGCGCYAPRGRTRGSAALATLAAVPGGRVCGTAAGTETGLPGEVCGVRGSTTA